MGVFAFPIKKAEISVPGKTYTQGVASVYVTFGSASVGVTIPVGATIVSASGTAACKSAAAPDNAFALAADFAAATTHGAARNAETSNWMKGPFEVQAAPLTYTTSGGVAGAGSHARAHVVVWYFQ